MSPHPRAPVTAQAVALQKVVFAWPGQRDACLRIDRFDAAPGEHVFVSGESGSGKSTLLGLLAGVLVPTEGAIDVCGTALHTLSGAQRDRFRADRMGIIFQQLNLLPYLSVLDNVLLACRFSAARRERVREQGDNPADAAAMLLGRLDLPEALWHRPASQLSVGQQQRVAAARALLGRPQLILADEPTSALDAARQAAFMDLLQRECRAVGASLIFVSHDERLARHFDRHFDRRFAMPMPAMEATA
ncbi:ATP-binding cassette domain-containing protein [Cupriavidus plantarum]|uniref:Putative ABC transport system ATP-binding protein n=1 Tax=Cupriavidus plantarum TaxID=942865 RepID=A0A316FBK7_9BURK|nr:ATP-binding cassette domain-containing protein [Cupriavidus plantarum]PWK34810.1 putative ABC transport system ATP-binding protein [Cupriavidus plantarum]CAG2137792.1 putative ABC transporter ATP-binding protein [Cupriavidus plantarum]SMR84984.1 putative ABC transport system ATP-binding protein [Cupriavidus plantarum]